MATASKAIELKGHASSLAKAIASQEPAENIISILEAMKSGSNPTEDLLRSTKAGYHVGKLRSHTNSDVKRLAGEIVSKWKKAVEMEKKRVVTPGKPSTPTTAAATPPASSPAPTASSAKFTGDIWKRNYKAEKVNKDRTDNAARDNCIGSIYNGLAYGSNEPADIIIAKAIEVENAAFTAHSGDGGSVTAAYSNSIRTLFANLKNKAGAGELGKKVMSGEIAAEKFVRMDAEELKSAELKKLEKKLEEENMKKAQVPMAEKSISTALECGKCKKKKVSYTQAQTRSADEPMTTFCECLNCGNRWKFS